MINQKTLEKFDRLYQESYQAVLKYVVCNCSNLDDVNDIVQNVYVDVLKSLEKNKSFNNSKSYVLGITRNKVKEYYRWHYRNKIFSLFSRKDDDENTLIDNVANDLDIEKSFILKEDLDFIWNFLKKKNIVIARIFYLYYYNNMTLKEISKELNLSESNVKHYLYRTLKELKMIMSDNRGEENAR